MNYSRVNTLFLSSKHEKEKLSQITFEVLEQLTRGLGLIELTS